MKLILFCIFFCLGVAAGQSTAPAVQKERFGGPPTNPLAAGVQVDREYSEQVQLSEERWNLGWFKRAGGDFGVPNTHLLVYLHSERCLRQAANGSCLEYGDYQKSLFFPRVDRLSRLEITDSFNTLSSDPTFRLWLSVKNGSVDWQDPATGAVTKNNTFFHSTKKHYTDTRSAYVVGSWTAFITMNRGYPTAIEWEEGCEECLKYCGACSTADGTSVAAEVECGFVDDSNIQGEYRPYDRDCNPGKCIDNICAVRRSFECLPSENLCVKCDDQTCNIKIYIAWKGTDKIGRVFNSMGSVPSVFRKFSFSPSYRQAAGIYTKQETFLLVGG